MSVLSLAVFEDQGFLGPLRPAEPAHPRALSDLIATVDRMLAEEGATPDANGHWIQLDGPEPTRHPDLAAVIAHIRSVGARVRLVSADADRLGLKGLERLRDAGAEQLDMWLLGATAASHDPCVGREGALDALSAMLPDLSRMSNLYTRARFVLRRANVAEVPEAVEVLGTYFHVFDVVRVSMLVKDRAVLQQDGVPRRVSLAALRTAWDTARRFRLPLLVEGFGTWPDPPVPSDHAPLPADDSLHTLLNADVVVPGLTNGTVIAPRMGEEEPLRRLLGQAEGDVQEIGLRLAAWGAPARDLPLALGGLDQPVADGHDAEALEEVVEEATTTLPAHEGAGRDARVAVIGGPVPDGLLATSTFSALTRALGALGADAVLHSPYERPFNPWAPEAPLPDTPLHPQPDGSLRYDREDLVAASPSADRLAHAALHKDAFLDGLDLSDRTLVVCSGWDVAMRVWSHPTLPADARVVVSDLHMLAEDLDGLTTDGWPDPRLVVHSIFPRYVGSHWRAGIPIRQVLWRPYPLHRGHFGLGPDPATRTEVFAGGNHGRDWRTLARAVQSLGDGYADRVAIHTGEAVPAPLDNRGIARLLAFHEVIANSRYVVVPLRAMPWRPAGISVFSMALAAGRPVLTTSTRAAHDHLRHGIDALIVPPNDPAAMAAAMRRLDEDDALITDLARGARQAGAALGVDVWTRLLLDGTGPRRVWPLRGDDARGPYQSWPRTS